MKTGFMSEARMLPSLDECIAMDVKTSLFIKYYNSASKSYKRVISLAKLEHINRIKKKLVGLLSGTSKFWSLAIAVLGIFYMPSFLYLRGNKDLMANTAKYKGDLRANLLNYYFKQTKNIPKGVLFPQSVYKSPLYYLKQYLF